MNRAIAYLESVSVTDDKYGGAEDIETVTITEAIMACKLQELAVLRNVLDPTCKMDIPARLAELEKQLRNIKIK
jgi:hypothetical protein